MEENFKSCSNCRQKWKSRNSFLSDEKVEIIGYQVHFEELTSGIFLFNHSCGSTLALPVSQFTDLYTGPVFKGKMTDTEECPGYCLYRSELNSCPVQCECAYIREIIQIIRNYSAATYSSRVASR